MLVEGVEVIQPARQGWLKRASQLWQWLKRYGIMLSHIPPLQIARRLQIVMMRCYARYFGEMPLKNAVLQEIADHPPKPVFPPRAEQVGKKEGSFAFVLPWGEQALTFPIDWQQKSNQFSQSKAEKGSWRARLQYMEFLEGADDQEFILFLKDWIQHSPINAPDAFSYTWRPYDLSLRTVVWMQQLAVRRDHIPPDDLALFCQSLTRQIAFLERYLETDICGNHLIKNAKALLWAGAFFKGQQAQRWYAKGRNLLLKEISAQILPDGMHHERSPSYHCQVMADLMEVWSVFKARKDPAATDLGRTIDQMADVVQLLGHPDGKAALFNDGGSHMAYAPGLCFSCWQKERGQDLQKTQGAFALPDAGYFGWRHEEELLVFDCGPLGPDALIGHGHGDILSFEWSTNGLRMIVDQGTYQYSSGPGRWQSRSTHNHNTPLIGQAEQGDFFGTFRCGRRPKPELELFEPLKDGFRFQGSHNGYRHLPGKPTVRRWAEYRHKNLTLRDEFGELPYPNAKTGFLLHPECHVDKDGDKVNIRHKRNCFSIQTNAKIEIEAAKWFPDMYVAQNCRRIWLKVPENSFVIETRVVKI